MSRVGWEVRLHGRIGTLEVELAFESDEGPVVMVGPNGSGKSTVLRTIAGARTGLRGTVRLGEHVLMDDTRRVDVPPEARRIGYVPQGLGLFPHMSALDNVAFGCGSGSEGRERARTQLERLDVGHLGDRKPGSLSGGERQRVALARALASEPAGLLLDEPLSALDVGQRRRTRTMLAEHLQRAGIPTLVVTHDLRDVMALGGHVVAIEAGRVVQQGSAEGLAAEPVNDFVAELFNPLA